MNDEDFLRARRVACGAPVEDVPAAPETRSGGMDERMLTEVRLAVAEAQEPADLLAELADRGYAIVKLPEAGVDTWGSPYWPVKDNHVKDASRVELRSDGRLGINSVPNPISDLDQAVSLAAALIAAARDQQGGTPIDPF